jgi:hypothetical protein
MVELRRWVALVACWGLLGVGYVALWVSARGVARWAGWMIVRLTSWSEKGDRA